MQFLISTFQELKNKIYQLYFVVGVVVVVVVTAAAVIGWYQTFEILTINFQL